MYDVDPRTVLQRLCNSAQFGDNTPRPTARWLAALVEATLARLGVILQGRERCSSQPLLVQRQRQEAPTRRGHEQERGPETTKRPSGRAAKQPSSQAAKSPRSSLPAWTRLPWASNLRSWPSRVFLCILLVRARCSPLASSFDSVCFLAWPSLLVAPLLRSGSPNFSLQRRPVRRISRH